MTFVCPSIHIISVRVVRCWIALPEAVSTFGSQMVVAILGNLPSKASSPSVIGGRGLAEGSGSVTSE